MFLKLSRGLVYDIRKNRRYKRICNIDMSRYASKTRWGWYVAAMGKRLGEDKFFSGAFDVFRHISDIFLAFCLVVMRNFVYLQAVKGVDFISHPKLIKPKEV